MVQVQNEYITKIIRDGTKLTLSEGVPDNMLSNIHVVFDATPDFHRTNTILAEDVKTTSGSLYLTMPSASRRTKVYLTNINLSLIKNVTCDAASGAIKAVVVIGGAYYAVCRIAVLTLTAQSENISVAFNPPLQIDAGADIEITGTFTAGSMVRSCVVSGFEIP